MEVVKAFLFEVFGILGMVILVLALLWGIICILNNIFKFSKYIIMYFNYRQNEELYDLKNKMVISKDGEISYSCISGLDEQERILQKALKNVVRYKELREKYAIK